MNNITDSTTTEKEWNNYKSPLSGMDKYGKPRLKLAVLLRDTVLKQLGIPWTIENGTLLGAWRNRKFILHDDDFDIAMFFETDPIPLLSILQQKIQQLLPPQYDARVVSGYANKIEVFDPSYGNYVLAGPLHGGASYHHVTVDLQCYQRCGDVYKSLYYANPRSFILFPEDIFPIGSIALERETFQAPFNVKSVLKCLYGSIAYNAKYNQATGRYEETKSEGV